MDASNWQLILTEPSGNYAIPEITITDDFAATFAIQNAADISQRKDNLTRSITFPGTKNNNRIFNNLWSFNRNSDRTLTETLFFNYSPTIGVRCVLYENNVPVMAGVLKINEVIKDEQGAFSFVGVITGNLVNFFGALKDKLLTDLTEFSDDVVYDWDNIQASWNPLALLDYVFPSIDYGKGVTNNRDFDYRNFRPAIYVNRYIKSILASQGYKYKSAFLDSNLSLRNYVPYSDTEFGLTVFGNVAQASGIATYEATLNRNDSGVAYRPMLFDAFDDERYIKKLTIDVTDTHRISEFGYNYETRTRLSDVWEFQRYSYTGIIINYDFDIYSHAEHVDWAIRVYKLSPPGTPQGVPVATWWFEFQEGVIAAGAAGSYGTEGRNQWLNFKGTFNIPATSWNKGDRYFLNIQTISDNGDDVEMRQNFPGCNITFTNPDATVGSVFNYDFGDTISLASALPKETKAIDFLKSLLTVFNLYLIQDPDDDKQLIIEPYDAFYAGVLDPANNSRDWTKKADNGKLHIKINTQLPKTYNFKFKEDKDFYNTLYKNTYLSNYGDFSIDNANGTADAKDLTLTFSATPVVTAYGDDKTMPAIFDGELTKKKPLKSNIRILCNNGSAACQSYDVVNTSVDSDGNYTGRGIVVGGATEYNTSHHLVNDLLTPTPIYNLLFGLPKAVYYIVYGDPFSIPTLYDTFYKALLSELNDENIFTVELDMHLTEADINTLDLRTPIFISTTQGQAYFKVMNVIYYSSHEVAKVTLQKIILT